MRKDPFCRQYWREDTDGKRAIKQVQGDEGLGWGCSFLGGKPKKM